MRARDRETETERERENKIVEIRTLNYQEYSSYRY